MGLLNHLVLLWITCTIIWYLFFNTCGNHQLNAGSWSIPWVKDIWHLTWMWLHQIRERFLWCWVFFPLATQPPTNRGPTHGWSTLDNNLLVSMTVQFHLFWSQQMSQKGHINFHLHHTEHTLFFQLHWLSVLLLLEQQTKPQIYECPEFVCFWLVLWDFFWHHVSNVWPFFLPGGILMVYHGVDRFVSNLWSSIQVFVRGVWYMTIMVISLYLSKIGDLSILNSLMSSIDALAANLTA